VRTYLKGCDILPKKVSVMSYMKYGRDGQWDRIAGIFPGVFWDGRVPCGGQSTGLLKVCFG
jgi:hypothetical protein